MHRVRALAALVALALAANGSAAAGPPSAGVLVPGESLGGLRLGMTLEQVEARWGRAYGRCRSCAGPTLYFNLFAFRPEGAGVELRRGRVAAVFTLWSPGAWRTSGGVRIGDRATSLAAAHERTSRTSCGGYAAHTLRTGRAVTAFYVVDGEVWGFGLLDSRTPVCR